MYLVMLYSNFLFFLYIFLSLSNDYGDNYFLSGIRVAEYIYKYSGRSDVIYCKYICGSQMIVLY